MVLLSVWDCFLQLADAHLTCRPTCKFETLIYTGARICEMTLQVLSHIVVG